MDTSRGEEGRGPLSSSDHGGVNRSVAAVVRRRECVSLAVETSVANDLSARTTGLTTYTFQRPEDGTVTPPSECVQEQDPRASESWEFTKTVCGHVRIIERRISIEDLSDTEEEVTSIVERRRSSNHRTQ